MTTTPTSRPARALAAARPTAAALALAALASGCFIDTQKFPGMLEPQSEPLPQGAKSQFERGAEEAFVIRHADPVSVRVAETNSRYRLAFYDKRTRVPAGSWVHSGPTGHAEVLLPGATQVRLQGRGSGVVGSESRREPVFTLVDVTIARVSFGETGQVQLPGGALLEASAGPFVVENVHNKAIRVRNRSAEIGRIAFRDEIISLEPSESVDLALLEGGNVPFETDPSSREVVSDAGPLLLRGEIDVLAAQQGTLLRATGASEVDGIGLHVELEPGDEVRFERIGGASPGDAASDDR